MLASVKVRISVSTSSLDLWLFVVTAHETYAMAGIVFKQELFLGHLWKF
jgi:hypothetical protein